MNMPSNKQDQNGDEMKGDEGVEHQLSVIRQANQQGAVKGFIAAVLLQDDELSFHIGGEFGTLSNQLGILVQAMEACKLYAQQRRALQDKMKKGNPSWGPGGTA